jgi:hypothetical protein
MKGSAFGLPLLLLMLSVSPGLLAESPKAQASPKTVYQEVLWDDLIPKKWLAEIKLQMSAISRLGFLVDGSQEADEAMQRLRQKWDVAPIDSGYLDKPIKIAGYVVPLEADRKSISEFLLVPYFGACIHLPPPPANQIILVRMAKPIKRLESMETVWVEGLLRDARVDTGIAVTGYAFEAVRTYPYAAKR